MALVPSQAVAPAQIGSPWPGPDGLVVAEDGLPARTVKAHNIHKAHYIREYASVVARSMRKKWRYRCYIDLYSGPGLCWVEDTDEFVTGSPLIATAVDPAYTHHVFVDQDSRCVDALKQRTAGANPPAILCADSNDPATIEWVRSEIPRRGSLSLALLDPQGCTLALDTIRQLTEDRPMDLLINLPIHNLYRCLAAGYFDVLVRVLGPDWPKVPVEEWRSAVRAHYRRKLAELGYVYSSAKEVRGEKNNNSLYDFVLASKHPLAKRLFEDVTRETAHGQLTII